MSVDIAVLKSALVALADVIQKIEARISKLELEISRLKGDGK